MMSLSWNEHFTAPTLVFSTTLICYACFTFLGHVGVLQRIRSSSAGERVKSLEQMWFHRLSGVLWLGIIPALVCVFTLDTAIIDLGLRFERWDKFLLSSLGFLGVFVPLIAWNARREQSWQHYPQVRLKSWSRRDFMGNALSWALYLVAYEFFFRGFFLYTTALWLGAWPAILLMTLIYFAVHLPKNPTECLGTIPMGIIFGILAVATGGIWAGVFGHCVIAIGNDFFVIRQNPALSWGPPKAS